MVHMANRPIDKKNKKNTEGNCNEKDCPLSLKKNNFPIKNKL
jgi:hypothetical protein